MTDRKFAAGDVVLVRFTGAAIDHVVSQADDAIVCTASDLAALVEAATEATQLPGLVTRMLLGRGFDASANAGLESEAILLRLRAALAPFEVKP